MKEEILKTDLLIIGGGVSGLNAALYAREHGAEVVVMDKGVIERSGHIAGGVDHFLAFLDTGPQWDTREAYLEFTKQSSTGATRLDVVDSVYCRPLKEAMKRFAQIGISLTQPNGEFFRTQSYGQPGPWWINFNGKRMKPALGKATRQAGTTVLDRVMALDLLTHEGQVCGALGLHIRTGMFYIVQAKAVLLATGGTNRMFQNPSGLSFNTWMCPANTGDGEAIAYRAGAALANVEYLRMTVTPRFFHAAGLNAMVGMGGKFINGQGQEFMANYHPLGMNAPRFKLAEGVVGETKAYRGPVFLDCRHLDEGALKHLITTLSYDKDTFADYFKQKAIDLKRDLMEVMVSDGMQGGPNEVCGSGIRIGPNCDASLPGLYAAGNSADQCRSLHMAVTSGYRAGQCALEYMAGLHSHPSLNRLQVDASKQRLMAPLGRRSQLDWHEFEDVFQRIMTEGVGMTRSAWGLERALNNLDQLDSWRNEVKADTWHDLMRLNEVFNLITVGRCTISAALERKESRFGTSQNRLDYPETDHKWQGQMVVCQGKDGRPQVEFTPLQY